MTALNNRVRLYVNGVDLKWSQILSLNYCFKSTPDTHVDSKCVFMRLNLL